MAISSGVRPATPRPPAKKPQVSRRSLLRTAWLGALGASVAGFSAGTVYFLWPNLSEGFGSKIHASDKTNIDGDIKANDGYAYIPDGLFYLVPYDDANDTEGVYKDVAGGGYMALYQRCVHLGCRVPWCATAQWWECPCHGSKYNQVGEYKEGPAPRGLDRFAITVQGGQIVVDTSKIVTGPPRGTNTTRQKAAQAGPGAPPSRRPGPTDEALEGRLLESHQIAGVALTVFLAVLLPFLYLREPARMRSAAAKEQTESVRLGKATFEEFCSRCHGNEAQGGTVKRYVTPGVKNAKPQDYPAPDLREIHSRNPGQDVATVACDTVQTGRPP